MTPDPLNKEKIPIGRTEYLDLPDWRISGLLAKVDTGARNSALHVEHLVELPENQVMFDVVLNQGTQREVRRVTAHVVRWGKVKSSSGHYNMRCFVRTHVQLGLFLSEIEMSLDSRDDMNYRMLLGRSALEHRFVVDVSKRNLLTPKSTLKSAPKKAPRKKQ